MLPRTKHPIIYNILEEIFSGEYRTNLALRGDTLSYFLYNLDLYLMDISIDMVRTVSDESRFQVYLESILMKYGKIRQKSQLGQSFFYILNYGESDENIRLEIYTKSWTESLYEIVNVYGLEMLAQEKSTIFTNKLIAILESPHLSGRDLYDLHFLFQSHFPINQLLIQERTGKNIRECLIHLLDSLENRMNRQALLDELTGITDGNQTISVDSLLSELVILVQSQISQTH